MILIKISIPDDTLQNCTLELATLGELKLVERPSPLVLGPRDFANIRASIKVASTENGVIFGNIGRVNTRYDFTLLDAEFLNLFDFSV